MKKFELNLRERNIPKEELIEDLKKVANSINQDTVTAITYAQKGKFGRCLATSRSTTGW